VTPAAVTSRRRRTQGFWTLIVGVPAFVSVLRLWAEAGGDLQTTLLLVENVGPVNLVAAFVTTTTWLVTTVVVALLAVAGVLLTADAVTPVERRALAAARSVAAMPRWAKVAAFGLAAVTWSVMFLPVLVLAAFAAAQWSPLRSAAGRGLTTLVLLAYGLVVWPTVADAGGWPELVVAALLVLPPLLTPLVAGPVGRPTAWAVAVALGIGLAVGIAVAVPLVAEPVLPLTVTVLRAPPRTAPTYVRGHVIDVDDVHTAILREDGGVLFVPDGQIAAQVLCPGEAELPRYRLFIRTVHVEDSLLRAYGRHQRPAPDVDPTCRADAGR
jgi:hypothetical protein